MIPAPFVIFEYIISILHYCKCFLNGEETESTDSFRIENLEPFQTEYYTKFETASRNKFYLEKYNKSDETLDQDNRVLIETVNRLDKSLDLFKIWVCLESFSKLFFVLFEVKMFCFWFIDTGAIEWKV